MRKIKSGSVDLVFADPPFNIGYGYDEYNDRKSDEIYLNWCREWISEIHRILKPSGTFWLAINDGYAAELKTIAQREEGFTMRNWVIWYFTFGANCRKRFTKTHAHLFYFVKDSKRFTFNAEDPALRIPSTKTLTRGANHGSPKGKLPDDTWILRPQAFQCNSQGFTPRHDTWFFPRVAGNFKERQKFHPCHMPEQILARIIRSCSNTQDVVFDPFTGSGTTLAVAKKLNRRFLGCELSGNYAKCARMRLKQIAVGDPLHGRSDPVGIPPKGTNCGKTY